MKNLLFILYAFLPMMAAAQNVVTVEQAGTLEEQVSNLGLLDATNLTIAGELNGTDILFLRSLLTDGTGVKQRNLTILDLSDVKIVEGGSSYVKFSVGSDTSEGCACYTRTDELGEYMFYGCETLSSVVLPRSVKSIGERCFAGALALTSIDVPVGVRRIGSQAFAVCSQLETVVLPSTLLSIDAWAFEDCPNLRRVFLSASVPPSFGFQSFSTPADCQLVLSARLSQEVVGYYEQADGWKTFGEIKQDAAPASLGSLPTASSPTASEDEYLLSGVKAVATSKGIRIAGNRKFIK